MTKPMLQVRAPRPPVSDAAADALLRRMEALEHVPALVPTPAPSTPTTTADARLVERRGRLRGDGSRAGARTVRRLTCYLPPELAQRLDVFAVTHGRDRSDVLADALDAWLERKA
jgi:hypothetical protein